MAGLGKKTFSDGDVLSAADVNGYLMDQSVMRFADSTARTAAIGTPTEGMVSYLDDTNDVEVFDGSGWVNFTGDITNVTAGTALDGGGSEGAITLDVNISDISTAQAGTALVATGEVLDVNISAISTAQAGTALVATGEVLDVDLALIAIPVSQITDLTSTATELNILDGVTATTAEINKLDGLTPTTAELNYVDGVTSAIQTQLDAKVDEVNGTVSTASTSLGVVRNIYVDTGNPTGGSDGDVWLKYEV